MDNKTCHSSWGTYALERFPISQKELRAWDAADEYLLDHLYNGNLLNANSKVLIINDSFGALSVHLSNHDITNWSDSFLAQRAYELNARKNDIQNLAKLLKSTEDLSQSYDVVLIKIPKSIALLKQQLSMLTALSGQPLIIGGCMIKHMPKTLLNLFNSYLGPSKFSLTRKKARLIFSEKRTKHIKKDHHSSFYSTHLGHELICHSNVFSKSKLDHGTALLLEQFKQITFGSSVVDLGCGSGILGIHAKQVSPQSNIVFIDESYMAIASAQLNYERVFSSLEAAKFIEGNMLEQISDKVDTILCNPPFHQQHVIGDYIAWQMFKQSLEKLNQGGELWIVGNRHMQYHSKLKKLFGNCDLIASDKHFVVLKSIKITDNY
ncbi:MAG: methyltransferase [Flavobacteriales bacterium]|nr:methyltransferase [Flavobacteriales bacterium]